jgi:putative transposase
MLITLQDAKDKFRFRLANFCIMPTHIHLLIEPEKGTNLSMIMQWLKTRSAKRWNTIHGSTDHVWGHRYFARIIRNPNEFQFVMDYIDQNPVKAGLTENPTDWKASGAFYKAQNIPDLVDFSLTERQRYVKLLSPIPPLVSRLLPPAQLEHAMQYFGTYAETIDRLYKIVTEIPRLGDTENLLEPPIYLHYFTGTADYFICEYDGEDTMFGKVRFSVYHPTDTEYRKFSLSNLKRNQFLQLDYSWVVTGTKIV